MSANVGIASNIAREIRQPEEYGFANSPPDSPASDKRRVPHDRIEPRALASKNLGELDFPVERREWVADRLGWCEGIVAIRERLVAGLAVEPVREIAERAPGRDVVAGPT
jgi:hypothetical protein